MYYLIGNQMKRSHVSLVCTKELLGAKAEHDVLTPDLLYFTLGTGNQSGMDV